MYFDINGKCYSNFVKYKRWAKIEWEWVKWPSLDFGELEEINKTIIILKFVYPNKCMTWENTE